MSNVLLFVLVNKGNYFESALTLRYINETLKLKKNLFYSCYIWLGEKNFHI